MATSSASKVKFKILSCSGEDPDYPIVELLTTSPQSKGWQSSRFCDYPQEVIVQFFSPIRIKQIQFLSHQCKIASRVELFSFIPDLNSVMPNADFKWNKLGFLSLDPNERSNFQARELKSVFLDTPSLYLKIHFHKCHQNRYNLFNQVGLIALSIYGDLLTNNPHEQQPSRPQQKYEKIGFTTHYDKYTLEKLAQLEEAKERAVDAEDFKEAKHLKNAIERLKYIATQLAELENRKAMAIQNEDYDTARLLKEEISKMRASINQTNNDRSPEKDERDHENRSPEQLRAKNELMSNVINEDNEQNSEEYKRYDDYNANGEQEYKDETHIRKEVAQPFDEQVIPALRNNKSTTQVDPDSVEDPFGTRQQQGAGPIEKLTEDNAKVVEPLIPYLGEEICHKLISKVWAEKQEGLQELNEELKKSQSDKLKNDDPAGLFIAVIGAVTATIVDKIMQVSQRSMNVLQTLLSRPTPKITSRSELSIYLDQTTAALIDKSGDTNHRVREHAEACYMLMCKNPVVSCYYCVTQLIKNTRLGNHKIANSTRHTVAKLGLLRQIIKEFGINNNDVPYAPIVEYVVGNIENSNAEIRNGAFNATVDIYRQVGDKIRESLMEIRQSQREALEKEFTGGGKKDVKKHRSRSPEVKAKGK